MNRRLRSFYITWKWEGRNPMDKYRGKHGKPHRQVFEKVAR